MRTKIPSKFIFILGAGVFSGKEIVTLNLMKELKTRGHDVFCITSNWCSKDFIIELDNANIRYKKLRLGFISKQLTLSAVKMTLHQLVYVPSLLYKLKQIFKVEKPAIIVHNNFHHNIIINAVIPTDSINIFHTHDIFANTPFYQKVLKYISKKMDVFVGVSEFVSNHLKAFDLNNKPVKTIYNGTSLEIKNTIIKQGTNVLKIGIVGQIGEWKGHKDLIEAISLIHTNKQIKCYIIGNDSNSFAESLKKYILQRKLNHEFVWLGFKSDLNEIYSSFDILVVPTRIYEALGMTAIEAGFFSIPVIASKKGGLPEVVRDGYNGFLVEDSNPISLKKAIEKFIVDESLIKKFGDNHLQTVKEKFMIENMALSFEELLSFK